MDGVTGKTVALTRIQKLIGRLMLQSKREAPCCYLSVLVDMTELVNMRKSYCKTAGVRVTTNDFFICAIGRAAKEFPLMAGRFSEDGENIQIAGEIGVGIAVAASQGLVVPVVKNVSEKSLVQIAADSSELVKKSRANKLDLDDFEGANIVFSSLGMYGVNSFFAIKPPDAACIISIGKFEDTIVPEEGGPTVRKMMSVGLAADCRIANEIYAAKFLNCITVQLEAPETLTG